MDINLYDKNGIAIAYISDDYNDTIHLWNGRPVAYLHEDQHVYGMNGKHLGWFIDSIIYNNDGERIGFTYESSPITVTKAPGKPEKYPMDEIRTRWAPPPLPKLTFGTSEQPLEEFLEQGQIPLFQHQVSTDESKEE